MRMYDDDNWTALTGDELAGFIDRTGTIDGRHVVSPETTEVARRSLPFYERAVLLRAQDRNWSPPNLNIYYLSLRADLYRLNGTSPPVHEVNARAPIRLREENVLDYLRFFCRFVRSEEGPFLILESLDNSALFAEIEGKTLALLEREVRPAVCRGSDERDCFICETAILHGNALHLASFAIHPDGRVEMDDDEKIAGNLNLKLDLPMG